MKGAKKLGYVFTGRTPHSVIIDAVSGGCCMAQAAKLMQGIKISSLVPVKALFQGRLGSYMLRFMYLEKSCLNIFEGAKFLLPMPQRGAKKLQTYMGNDSSFA